MLPHYREIMARAISEGEISLDCKTSRLAHSIRQKFYRRRRILRTSSDPLALLVDDLTFSIEGSSLIIIYSNPDELNILQESINVNPKTTSGDIPDQSESDDRDQGD